jgi:hypothetical protein
VGKTKQRWLDQLSELEWVQEALSLYEEAEEEEYAQK